MLVRLAKNVETFSWNKNSSLFELTGMLMRLDHVARRIVNANHSII